MMNNGIKKILITIVAAMVLSSCTFMDSLYNSDAVAVNPDDALENPDQDGETTPVENPKASLELKYIEKTNEIEAQVITDWNEAPQGSVYLTWTAPKDTGCYNTSFPITKYKDNQDYTRDNQRVVSKGKVCKGKWGATIVNKSNNAVLAKETITIK